MINAEEKAWAYNIWLYFLLTIRSIIFIPFVSSLVISLFSPRYILWVILFAVIYLLTWFANYRVAKGFQRSSAGFITWFYKAIIEPRFLACPYFRKYAHLVSLEENDLYKRLQIQSALDNISKTKIEKHLTGDYVKGMQTSLVPDKSAMHIVFDDTLWKNGLNDDHRLALAAHEQGHYICSTNKKSHFFDKETKITALVFLICFAILIAYLCVNREILSFAEEPGKINGIVVTVIIVLWVCLQTYRILHNSRIREDEFFADSHAIKILGDPTWLVEALRISYCYSLIPTHVPRFIEAIFEDHPSLEKRIKRIENLVNS